MRTTHKIVTLVAVLILLFAMPSQAVIILDSTYKKYGFKKAEALALEPQFRALMFLDGGKAGSGSGVWIGNYHGHGYVLTAAHMFSSNYPVTGYYYYTRDSYDYYEGEAKYIHPLRGKGIGNRTGYDFAIVKLTKEVTDAGPQPALYGGTSEEGRTLVFMGFGRWGEGTGGQNRSIDTKYRPAAAEGLIELVVDAVEPVPKNNDAGSYFGIWLPKEDGSVPNPLRDDGITKPQSPLSGLLGSGDSGGPAWIETNHGWAIAGINSNGNGNASYGDKSWFARVSHVRPWIKKIVPTARFIE